MHTVQQIRPRVRVQSMLVHVQVRGSKGSATMLAVNGLAGVAPEVNLRKPRADITRIPKHGYQ